MACPYCGSNNVRPAERGLTSDTYYCNDCNKGYSQTSPKTKGTVLGVIGTIVLVLLGAG